MPRSFSTPKVIPPEKALIRCEELCARAERCEHELREKMRAWRIDSRDIEAIINSLTTRRFLDDSRFARAFVRDKYRFARWGRRKIAMALKQKRIDSDTIDEALEEINQEEYTAVLRTLLKAKAAHMDRTLSYDDRVKLFRFAVARGFETQLISSMLKS